jgi:gliding motility-associated-like protein
VGSYKPAFSALFRPNPIFYNRKTQNCRCLGVPAPNVILLTGLVRFIYTLRQIALPGLCLLCCIGTIHSQSFSKRYDFPGTFLPAYLSRFDDGKLALGGTTGQWAVLQADGTLLRAGKIALASAGDSAVTITGFAAIPQSEDLVVVMRTPDFILRVLRIDAAGKVLWSKAFEGLEARYSFFEIKTLSADADYLYWFNIEAGGLSGNLDFARIRLSDGALSFAKTYTWQPPALTTNSPGLYRLAPDRLALRVWIRDNNFTLFGHSALAVVDDRGDVIGAKTVDSVLIHDIQPIGDGAFLASGIRGSAWFVARFDANLNPLWAKRVAFPDQDIIFLRLAALPDGGFYLHGTAASNDQYSLTVRLDAQGTILWTRAYPDGNYPGPVRATESGGLMRTGVYWVQDVARPYLFHFDPDGNCSNCPVLPACRVELSPLALNARDASMLVADEIVDVRPSPVSAEPLGGTVRIECPALPLKKIDFELDADTICAGETVVVRPGAGFFGGFGVVQWRFQGGIAPFGAPTQGIRYETPGQYQVASRLYAGGCPVDSIFRALRVMPPIPPFSIGPDTALCPGDTLPLHAPTGLPAGTSLLWQNGAGGPVFHALQPGRYILRAHNGVCDAADSLEIAAKTMPLVALPPDTAFCAGARLTIRVFYQNARILRWQNGETASTLQIDRPGLYWIEARDGRCVARDSIEIREMDCPDCRFYFPNVFAPERGDENAVFGLYSNCLQLTDYELFVYDRWGDLVFYSDNPTDAWNGTWRGRKAMPGMYKWFCRLAESAGPTPKRRAFEGTVLLAR